MKNKDHITVSSEDRARVVFHDAMGNTVITSVLNGSHVRY